MNINSCGSGKTELSHLLTHVAHQCHPSGPSQVHITMQVFANGWLFFLNSSGMDGSRCPRTQRPLSNYQPLAKTRQDLCARHCSGHKWYKSPTTPAWGILQPPEPPVSVSGPKVSCSQAASASWRQGRAQDKAPEQALAVTVGSTPQAVQADQGPKAPLLPGSTPGLQPSSTHIRV